MFAVGGFWQAVAVEDDKVGVDAFLLHELPERVVCLLAFVEVVEDGADELVVVSDVWRGKRIEFCVQRVASEMVFIGTFQQQFLSADAVEIARARFQVLQENVVFDVVAHLLAVEDGTGTLCVERVGAKFHPAMAHAIRLEHHVDRSRRGELQIRRSRHQFAGGRWQSKVGEDGAVV